MHHGATTGKRSRLPQAVTQLAVPDSVFDCSMAISLPMIADEFVQRQAIAVPRIKSLAWRWILIVELEQLAMQR